MLASPGLLDDVGISYSRPDVVVWLPGLIRGKGRPRSRIVTTKTGDQFVNHYSDTQTRSYEAQLKFAAEKAMEGICAKPMDGALRCRVTAFFDYPSTWSVKKRDRFIHQFVKPDGDNICKCVGDALNKVVWVDDARVSEWIIRKMYDDRPGLLIEVWRLGGALL